VPSEFVNDGQPAYIIAVEGTSVKIGCLTDCCSYFILIIVHCVVDIRSLSRLSDIVLNPDCISGQSYNSLFCGICRGLFCSQRL
jgi:hypothetical protein